VGGHAVAVWWKDVRVGIEGRPGKRRGPWAVWLLAVVTCGVYGLVWYYKVNRELRDCGAGVAVRPVLSVLALLPGVVLCYVPLFTSIYRTGERIRRAQAQAGLQPSCGPGLALLLVFALGLWPVYYQSQLNKVWITADAASDDAAEESAIEGAGAADEDASDEVESTADGASDEIESAADGASDELEPVADEGAAEADEEEPAAEVPESEQVEPEEPGPTQLETDEPAADRLESDELEPEQLGSDQLRSEQLEPAEAATPERADSTG
jgi:hypothetical protein